MADLASLLGKKPAAPEEAPAGDLSMVAEDLIAAVKAGDAEAVASALRASHEICSEGYPEEV